MYCTHCGKEISDIADVCIGCGRSVKKIPKKAENDSNSVGWWWLGFLLPIVGFILWAVWTADYPMKAKKAGWGAIVGVIVSVVAVVLIYILYFALIIMLGIGMSDFMY